MKKINYLGIILVLVMISSLWMPWKAISSSMQLNSSAINLGGEAQSESINAFQYSSFSYLIVMLSLIGGFLSFKNVKFSFVIGILNLVLGICYALNLITPAGSGAFNIEIQNESMDYSGKIGFENQIGIYIFLAASLIYSILEFKSYNLLTNKNLNFILSNNEVEENNDLKEEKGINKKIILAIIIAILSISGYFIFNKVRQSMTQEITLWDLILDYKNDERGTLNKFKGKKIQITGWLEYKHNSSEGDEVLTLRGTSTKDGKNYIMDSDIDPIKPADKNTGYTGMAVCKMQGSIKENLIPVSEKESKLSFDKVRTEYFQEVTVEGILDNVEKTEKSFYSLGTNYIFSHYFVKMSKCKVVKTKNLSNTISQEKPKEIPKENPRENTTQTIQNLESVEQTGEAVIDSEDSSSQE
ncbi:MAG: hypothetical protein ACEQSR_00265 [Candidatus Methylacidiphilales bacterium]